MVYMTEKRDRGNEMSLLKDAWLKLSEEQKESALRRWRDTGNKPGAVTLLESCRIEIRNAVLGEKP